MLNIYKDTGNLECICVRLLAKQVLKSILAHFLKLGGGGGLGLFNSISLHILFLLELFLAVGSRDGLNLALGVVLISVLRSRDIHYRVSQIIICLQLPLWRNRYFIVFNLQFPHFLRSISVVWYVTRHKFKKGLPSGNI